MPELSRFFGIIIRMRFNEHPPPHFHAYFRGYSAAVSIQPCELLAGELPPVAWSLVYRWTRIHEQELIVNWQRVQEQQTPVRIPPLE